MSRGLKAFSLLLFCRDVLLFCRDFDVIPLLEDAALPCGGTGLALRLRVLLRLPAILVCLYDTTVSLYLCLLRSVEEYVAASSREYRERHPRLDSRLSDVTFYVRTHLGGSSSAAHYRSVLFPYC